MILLKSLIRLFCYRFMKLLIYLPIEMEISHYWSRSLYPSLFLSPLMDKCWNSDLSNYNKLFPCFNAQFWQCVFLISKLLYQHCWDFKSYCIFKWIRIQKIRVYSVKNHGYESLDERISDNWCIVLTNIQFNYD